LVAAHLLKPLGSPQPNSVKYFAAAEVLKPAQDRTWLAKVANALTQHWQKKNSAKKKTLVEILPRMHDTKVSVVMAE